MVRKSYRITTQKKEMGMVKRALFGIVLAAVLTVTSNVFAFSDNFNDGSYSGVWTADEALNKFDGVNWRGWKEETGVMKNAAYESYQRKATANGVSAGAGTYSVDIERDYFGSAGGLGLVWGGDQVNSMYTAGVEFESGAWNLMLQQWSSPNGGVNWTPVGAWNVASINALTPYLWKTLSLNVGSTQATLSMDSTSLSMALPSGAPSGPVGLYNSVGWTSFDNFNANPIPEPASMLLLGSGLLGVFVSRRKK